MTKPKVIRVVTASYVVPWHLHNTLVRLPADFDVRVVGQDVSRNAADYPGVAWTDIDLERKVNPLSDLVALVALVRLFRRERPDIVHSIMPKAGLLGALAGWMTGVPVRLHTFTGQVWAGPASPRRLLLRALDRLVNRLNTDCLTDSPSQSAFLLGHGISRGGQPLAVLGKGSLSGVDVSRFDRGGSEPDPGLRSRLGIPADAFVFAFIARKSVEKGALDMLQAFSQVAARFPEAWLLFVGPDESDGRIDRLARSRPEWFSRVVRRDRVSRHEEYLAAADLLCLPSHREGFGTIVIDAAAAGLPTIGTRIVGLVDAVVDGETGLLVPPGSPVAFAEAMASLAADPARCRAMGRAAQARAAREFGAAAHYASLRAYYEARLGGGR